VTGEGSKPLAHLYSVSILEEIMEEHWLWPFKGGTWTERLWALAYALELVLSAAAFYWLAWALAPYF